MLLEHRVLLVLELREPCCLRYRLELGLEGLELGLQQVLVQVLEQEQVLALELEQEFEPVVAAAVVAVAAAVVVVVPVREQVLDFV